jgi:hypothetical protein
MSRHHTNSSAGIGGRHKSGRRQIHEKPTVAAAQSRDGALTAKTLQKVADRAGNKRRLVGAKTCPILKQTLRRDDGYVACANKRRRMPEWQRQRFGDSVFAAQTGEPPCLTHSGVRGALNYAGLRPWTSALF